MFHIRELSFFTGRGRASVCGVDHAEFFGVVKGGVAFFFQWAKGGDQNFLRVKEGGPKFFLNFFS